MEIVAWIGSIALSLCAAPQAYRVYQDKHAYFLSGLSLSLWWLGEALTLIYLLTLDQNVSNALIANYTANLGLVSIMLYYKLWPQGTEFPKSNVS